VLTFQRHYSHIWVERPRLSKEEVDKLSLEIKAGLCAEMAQSPVCEIVICHRKIAVILRLGLYFFILEYNKNVIIKHIFTNDNVVYLH